MISVPVPVTAADLGNAQTLREAVYRTAKAVIDGWPPAVADEDIINRAASAAPPCRACTRGH